MIINILKFAWKNIWRNRRRTLLTLTAIVVGVTAVVFARSYIKGITDNINESFVRMTSGHVRVAHSEYLRLVRIMPKDYMVPGLDQLGTEIAALPGVERLDRRIQFNVLLSHGDASEAGVAIGIDIDAADKSMKLSESIVEGHYFPDSSANNGLNLVIGQKLAEKLGVGVNDELLIVTTDINYSTYALPFKIVGIFETGFIARDKRMLYIPLGKAQEMLDCGDAAQEVLVFVENPDHAGETAESIRGLVSGVEIEPGQTISVIPWQEDDMIASTLPMMENIYGKIILIIMLIVALVILNTMLMAVMERYHEIGVIKAMGLKNFEIFSMILVESFYIGAIGSALGILVGGGLAGYVEKVGLDLVKLTSGMMEKIELPIPVLNKVLYTDLTVEILIGSLVFGILTAMFAALYPAVKSSRMLPVEAFRSELKV